MTLTWLQNHCSNQGQISEVRTLTPASYFKLKNPRRSREWLTDGGKLSAGLISQSNFLTQYILQFKQIVES